TSRTGPRPWSTRSRWPTRSGRCRSTSWPTSSRRTRSCASAATSAATRRSSPSSCSRSGSRGATRRSPRPLITLATVIAYGPWTAFAFSIAGNVIAACVAYAAGRRFGRDTVRRIAGERLNRLCGLLRRRGLLAVVAVRLVPVAPFVVENVVGGAVHIRFWQFAVGTAIGHVPGTLATTVFGSQIEAALREPGDINWWLVGA